MNWISKRHPILGTMKIQLAPTTCTVSLSPRNRPRNLVHTLLFSRWCKHPPRHTISTRTPKHSPSQSGRFRGAAELPNESLFGQNKLGKLLMELRSELKAEQ